MDYITTTDLRTKSSQLINSLEKGTAVPLVHRSQIVGIIKPQKKLKRLSEADITELKKLADKASFPAKTYDERQKIYQKHLKEKYGKDIS